MFVVFIDCLSNCFSVFYRRSINNKKCFYKKFGQTFFVCFRMICVDIVTCELVYFIK